MPDLQADVPERADQPLERFALAGLRLVREQDEQIDIGARIELAAPITPGGNQRRARGQARHGLHGAVDELRMRFQQRARLGAGEIRGALRGALGRDLLAQRRRAHEGAGGVPAETVSTS